MSVAPVTPIGPDGPELLPLSAGEQYRFSFAMDACVGCHSCEVACAEQNGLPPAVAWRRVGEFEGGDHPRTRRFHLSMSCNHCLDPACLTGCPTEAYVKLDNGVVAHHADDCIGCQYCTWNCPYSVPAFQPDRRIVTKCDMCLPRLDAGLKPACVGACPTRALDVEVVSVDAWRADHAAADAPHLPPSDLTLSTTRIVLPKGDLHGTVAASDVDLAPEHPHWPLVVLTLLTQVALGVSLTGMAGADLGRRLLAAALAGAALAGSLAHLGRPAHAWKALRNLRRSWLSREVLLLGAYAGLAAAAVLAPPLAPAAAVVGVAGVFASGRLYVVPGRPSWDTPLTVVAFYLTALATGPLLTGLPALAAAAVVAQLAVWLANLVRLSRDPRREATGTVALYRHPFAPLTALRWALAAGGVAMGWRWPLAGCAAVVLGELAGRYLFYVTVVPLNMPGTFFGPARRHG
ncbi:MAG TPA: DmsC/YnfH family molybdoenzyme membrane anchor subunit [Acidimicrobiales bacterium]|nr:DmsC/YnfH family molybdoenzyme membrane anchor subunit [Acidimicrobiales bacterium]